MEIDSNLIDEFISEAGEHLEEAEKCLLLLEEQTAGPEVIDQLFRGIHSIKGTAGFLNLEAIAELSHAMENLLSLIRAGTRESGSEVIDALLRGTDFLNRMLAELSAGKSDNIPEYRSLLPLLAELSGENTSAAPIGEKTPSAQSKTYFFSFPTPEQLADLPPEYTCFYEIRMSGTVEELKGAETEMLNFGYIIEQHDEDGMSAVLLATMIEADLINDIITAPEFTAVLLSPENEQAPLHIADAPAPPVQTPPAKPVKAASEKVAAERTGEAKNVPSSRGNETVRINVEVLDQLMNLAGELVLIRNQHIQHFTGRNSMQEEISRRFDAVTSELQTSIMGIRMQPLGNVFGKLPRIARDLAKRLDKKIDLTVSGEEVEVDKTILESLADPLTHIIRNSCDHGLECTAERLTAGKPPVGRITVGARHEGGQIIVSIADDGRGIDPEKIRHKVLEKGLRKEEELMLMTPKQIISLIMLPGFSTAAQVSDISGRGVGMDVVKTSIEKLGGTLDIDSAPGQGTTLSLALPLTLAIMPSLIITSGGRRYAIPQINLEEVICLFGKETAERIEIFNRQEVFRHHDNLLQLVRLEDVLSSAKPRTADGPAPVRREPVTTLNIAVVKVGTKRYGLAIDSVLGIEEIVVKPMHPVLKGLRCYQGTMILGDGTVSLILDIDGIARHMLGQIHCNVNRQTPQVVVARSDDAQRVLTFSSGTKENFAVSLALVKRVDCIDPADIQYIGDRRFISIDGTPTQVISLDQALQVSPCEMNEDMFLILPKHIKRPFGILASSFHNIENAVANFQHCGYTEDGILGTAMLNGRLTVFPDIYRVIEKIEPEWFAAEGHVKHRQEDNRAIRILLAEDTPFFRQLVKKYLESDLYQVETAANGREALELLSKHSFDMLLSDLEMPLMNGWQLVEAIRNDSRFNDIPAIALTSLDSERDRQSALQSGFNDYIVKIEREKFLGHIAGFLAKHRRKS